MIRVKADDNKSLQCNNTDQQAHLVSEQANAGALTAKAVFHNETRHTTAACRRTRFCSLFWQDISASCKRHITKAKKPALFGRQTRRVRAGKEASKHVAEALLCTVDVARKVVFAVQFTRHVQEAGDA